MKQLDEHETSNGQVPASQHGQQPAVIASETTTGSASSVHLPPGGATGNGSVGMKKNSLVYDRLIDSFTQTFMTYFGIVQGLTLGYLVFVVGSRLASPDLRFIVLAFDIFVVIFTNWIEYAINTMIFRWIPGILDAVLPMVVGLAELYTIQSLDGPFSHWVLGIGVISGLGYLAFWNFYHEASKYDETQNVLRDTSRYRWINYGFTAWGCLSAIGFCLIQVVHLGQPLDQFVSSRQFQNSVIASFTAIIVFFLIRGLAYWQSIRQLSHE